MVRGGPWRFRPKLTTALRKLSHGAETTVFVTLMAAFKVLLYRYSGQADIVVGYPRANRDRTEIERLIGCFVDMLPWRSDLSGAPTWRELLARVHSGFVADQAQRDVPFERIVDTLQLKRDLSRAPIFQVMFIFQPKTRALELSNIECQPLDVGIESAKFDLTLSLGEKDGALNGFFEYRSDLFNAATIDRMASNYRTLLQGIVADPDCSIAQLPIVALAERRRLLVEWNKTAADFPETRCLHELFEAQAKRTPNTIAVEIGKKRVTYRDLNRRANRLAHYLKRLGIGREDRVAICLDRSIEMVSALLAVLKAGAVYLPLDPEYPRERLEFILTDARASVLVTQKSFTEDRTRKIDDRDSRRKVILLDRDWPKIRKQSAMNSKSRINSSNLAYVIYTSGSTGQPKGVEIEHRSLVNCLIAMRRQLKLTKCDVWLAVTTISFDIAAAELFLPLISGAKLVIASRDETRDGERLVQRLKKSTATVMQATPSSWRLLLENGWQSAPQVTMLCGGEALPRQLADRLIVRGKALWNFYGPTETTIWSTSRRVDRGVGPVPIGRPLANTEIYLLDDRLQPVPIGVPGEIFIGGAGVARGYANVPQACAEKLH
jgi:amino acid adenylation domain-containing protein